MRDRPVNVVVIESLSYTGTTWLNLVLGCHERAIGIGPPDRVRDLREGSQACLVHGEKCLFWPGFFESYDPSENFFIQLADYSGKDYIITNNPVPEAAGRDLDHPDIWVRRIRVVRDARGVFSSWLRVHPDTKVYRDNPELSRISAVETFAPIIFREHERIDPENPGILFCKYEDVLADKKGWLERFSKFLGIDYAVDAYRYWDHDIHPTSGNQGTISLIKFAQGIPVPDGYKDKEFYQRQFDRAVADKGFETERWREDLDEKTQLQMEIGCQTYLRDFDYPRGSFSLPLLNAAVGEIEAERRNCPFLYRTWKQGTAAKSNSGGASFRPPLKIRLRQRLIRIGLPLLDRMPSPCASFVRKWGSKLLMSRVLR